MRTLYTLIIPIVILACLGCKTKKETAKDNGQENGKSGDLVSVEIKLTRTHSHCGGMAPTPDMQKNARTPKPFSTTVYLKKGTENNLNSPIYKTLNSNGDGIISIELEPGDYIIVRENKKDKATFDAYVKARSEANNSNYKGFTKECYLKYFKTPDLAFTVSDTSKQFSRNFHKKCFYKPCENYVGPYPP